MWQGAQQEEQARETEQLRLLTTLNDRLTEAEARLDAGGVGDRSCDDTFDPGRGRLAELRAALSYYEYLAWLYDEGELQATNSRDVFAPRLLTVRDVATRLVDPDPRKFPQLHEFAKEARPEPCPPQ